MRGTTVSGPLVCLLLAGLAVGCSSNTEKAPAKGARESGGAASTADPHATAGMQTGHEGHVHALQWEAPAGFQQEEPANTMRIAQYRIPTGEAGKRDGELAIFFFGPGGGGDTQSNLVRWAGQFKQEDGSDPMKVAKLDTFQSAGGLKISTIELAGRYESAMAGGPSYNEPAWSLYGAVVEGSGGPWFLKAVGPAGVMAKHRPALHRMMQGLSVSH